MSDVLRRRRINTHQSTTASVINTNERPNPKPSANLTVLDNPVGGDSDISEEVADGNDTVVEDVDIIVDDMGDDIGDAVADKLEEVEAEEDDLVTEPVTICFCARLNVLAVAPV